MDRYVFSVQPSHDAYINYFVVYIKYINGATCGDTVCSFANGNTYNVIQYAYM